MSHTNTLSDLLCYTSITFSITFDNSTFRVWNERTKQLIEEVTLKEYYLTNKELFTQTFEELKTKYILNYDNAI